MEKMAHSYTNLDFVGNYIQSNHYSSKDVFDLRESPQKMLLSPTKKQAQLVRNLKSLLLPKESNIVQQKPTNLSSNTQMIKSQFEQLNIKDSKQENGLRIGILGAKVWQGQRKHGVELGPDMMRKAGIVDRLKQLSSDVKDFGDICPIEIENDNVGKIANPRIVGDYCKKLSDKVASIVRDENRLCVVLGGDHSLAAGSLHGHVEAHPDVCVVWVDAHTDLHLPHTTPSGNLHGCPMGLMIRELNNSPNTNSLPGWEWHVNRIPASNLVYIGSRDVDTAEMYFLKRLGIRYFSTREIDEIGMQNVARLAIQHINPYLDKPIVIQFDIDSLDPLDAPTTGTPVDGGMTLREGLTLVEELCRTKCVIGIDMVEVNVKLGTETEGEKTVRAANKLIATALGEPRHGFLPPDFTVKELPVIADRKMRMVPSNAREKKNCCLFILVSFFHLPTHRHIFFHDIPTFEV